MKSLLDVIEIKKRFIEFLSKEQVEGVGIGSDSNVFCLNVYHCNDLTLCPQTFEGIKVNYLKVAPIEVLTSGE